MSMEDNRNKYNNDFNTKVAVLLMGVGLAVLLVTIYHCIMMRCRGRGRARGPGPTQQLERYVPGILGVVPPSPSVMSESSVAQLFPAYAYRKGMGLGRSDDADTCAICLNEFEEGEELRTLTECKHSYHVPCIDMWLYSHSSCPTCRAEATPTPSHSPSPQEGHQVRQTLGTLQNIIVQSRTL